MGKKLSVVLIAVITGLAAITARAITPTYDSLFVFGDSYCDVGNLYIADGGVFPAAPYYNGRFSNGPIWLDHVAGFLGLPLTASLQGGTDYAFGGAWVTAPQPLGGGFIPSVPQQVELYLSQHGGKADPNALYVIEGGGNDILGTTSGSPYALAYQIAVGIIDSEQMLQQAGARHFVIPNLFNVGILPAASGNTSFAAAASTATNHFVEELLEPEDYLPDIQIVRMDVFSLMTAVGTDPTHFGFTDLTDPCLTTTLCADPDHTFFWDIHHPSEFGHAFFAVTLENALARRGR